MALTNNSRQKFLVQTIPFGMGKLYRHEYEGRFELDPSGALLIQESSGKQLVWGPGVWQRIDLAIGTDTDTSTEG
ncbi:hypothetical protein CH281_20320 [Rhodococcus sp. 06-221-2]|uniref:hypothetical protein n=1 Tax=unclassified Rhodococcus (in: high G+C Gram-positive bacteria) TaxID=192944 RepID=UPI000A71400C|nr:MULTISPECIES: hypothetical protein [unclassified Rhodococcus (in: high G+C Gram-positive bacteria)]OZC98913.1 hypothetical protein CH281_20320 [Rhodococcus sp. 06-221-2]